MGRVAIWFVGRLPGIPILVVLVQYGCGAVWVLCGLGVVRCDLFGFWWVWILVSSGCLLDGGGFCWVLVVWSAC